MSYSERFKTKAASDEHDERIKELQEIQVGLESNNVPDLFILQARLARVIELIVEDIK